MAIALFRLSIDDHSEGPHGQLVRQWADENILPQNSLNIMWKSRGGIMVNVSPREVQRGYVPHYPQRLFLIMPFFITPPLVNGIFLQSM